MSVAKYVELLESDGAYIAGRILDEERIRVIMSNIAPAGAVLIKQVPMDWHEAGRLDGNATWLSPYDLIRSAAAAAKDETPYRHDLLVDLDSDDEFLREMHGEVEARTRYTETGVDPGGSSLPHLPPWHSRGRGGKPKRGAA